MDKEIISKVMAELGARRWAGTTEKQRRAAVPRTGGAPRKYTFCKDKKPHRFRPDNTCSRCGEPKAKLLLPAR